MYNDLLFDLRYAELKKKHPQIPMYALCGRAADAIESLDREAQQQHEFIKMLHGALEKVLEANKWISVDEALPCANETVIGLYENGKAETVAMNKDRTWRVPYGIMDADVIKYWRRIQTPPIDGD